MMTVMKSSNGICFVKDVLAQCKTTPERICVIDGESRRTTYADFLDLIERTSGYIASQGITKGSFIVINLPNCMEYLAVEYGIWACGCAIVPSGTQYPQARVDYIAEHCGAKLVIDADTVEQIKKAPGLQVCDLTEGIAAIFYTSGSSGTPKGVVHTFETLGHIDRFNDISKIGSDDCFGVGSPMSFIASMFTVPYLRVGGCVRYIPTNVMKDITLLQNCFNNEEITGAFLNPSLLKQLDLKGNKTLKYIITGSERVINLESQSSYKLICLYGMTETCGLLTFCPVDHAYANTPIGKPYSDLEFKLSDDGEMCFRGPLSPGYFKDPERSAELWKGGWFHTGDIGRLLPDGRLEYVNRKDWMVKINGQRVETGESAYVMKEVEGVDDAVVKGFTAPDGHQYLVGYYISPAGVSVETIRQHLDSKLASYMIPGLYVKLDVFPRTVNGKIDMKSLQSPLDLSGEREIVPPDSEQQRLLCSAFETALGISPISVDDDFFAMGGDSIRVMQLQKSCPDLRISTDVVYRYRTPRKIAEAVAVKLENMHRQVSSGAEYPLSKSQTGIFVECMNRRGEAIYNNPLLYKLSGRIDAEKLAEACVKVMQNHIGLFAKIGIDSNGIPYQMVQPVEALEIKVEKTKEKQLKTIMKDLVRPFDILEDRLFRIRIFRSETAVWLFADFHHIVFDGSSNEIIIAEIEQAYSGQELVAEQVNSFDIASEEAVQRSDNYFEESRKWYLDNFSDIDETTLPSPDCFSESVQFTRLEIPSDIAQMDFIKTASRLGVTENVLATAAFGYMLGACNHGTSSAFATIYNGRKDLSSAHTVAMMVKTLPVSCKWDEKTTVDEYLQAVKTGITGAMAHDIYSFAELCSSTAFDSRILFGYQDELLGRSTLCGQPCELIQMQENATGEPMTVQLYKKDGVLFVRAEYMSNMYSQEYVRSLMGCFTTILSSFTFMEKTSLTSELRLVSKAQELEIIDGCRGINLDYDKTETFVTMFRRMAKQYPDYTAVVDENRKYTYAQLDRMSDILAATLVEEGVKVEDFVAVMMPRLGYFPISYIACFKCGAAYVPVDYEYPLDRITYMLEDSCSRILITTRAIYESKFGGNAPKGIKVIFVEELQDKDVAPMDKARPEGLAYMIYTSGTTGRPKGVMVEHRGLTNVVKWTMQMEDFVPGCRVAEHASFSFDGSMQDMMVPLCVGGELHLLPSSIRKDLPAIYRYYCENKIDGGVLTTQLGMAMMRSYDLKLKYLFVGGEKLSGNISTNVHLYNEYGPTEFTVASSYHRVDTAHPSDNIPIGKAVPNTLSAVVDSLGRLLPKGIPGELVLIGRQLARGYWQREDLTAQRFAACSFIKGEKMYHTGDLVRWNENYELLYMGRIDTQVKLRGFRIELGEIESNMAKFEGIKTAVAVIKEIAGVQHLCGYYSAEAPVDHQQLRTFLSSSLTEYMVPTAFVYIKDMPMTPNGKVDVRSLPLPEIKAEEIVAPSDGLEKQIFDIVSENLGNDQFGVTTNLISMGMTSLGAISLSMLIEKKLSVKIPSSSMLEGPTIRQWMDIVMARADEQVLEPFPLQDDYPLTDNQLGVYIDWEQHRDSTQYNVPMLFHFEDVPAGTLVSAVEAFIGAHPYLKMRIRNVDGKPRQTRCDNQKIEIISYDLNERPERDFFQQKIHPFDLYGGNLCRFEIYSFCNETWLLSDIHHIVFDGGSENLLAHQIVAFCNGIEPEKETFSAFDYSLYHQQWKESDAFGKAKTYFDTLLEQVTCVTVPGEGEGEGTGSGALSLKVGREAVRNCCRREGITENAFFLTAITQTLHRLTRENDIAVLTVSNGRSLSSLQNTAGMFVQTLPVVSHCACRSTGETLQTMHRQVVETLSRDKYPFTSLVEQNGLKANIMVAYQGGVMGEDITVGGKAVQLQSLALDTAKIPLSINVIPQNDSIELLFEYDKACYKEEPVRIFAKAVAAFAENLSTSGNADPISSIACVTAAEAEEIIKVGSGEKMEVEQDATFVTLFKRCVGSTPDAKAVVDCESFLTYAELDRCSDILAAKLVEAGIEKDMFVALMMPRRKEYSLAYVAVYKSGGAYVPLDYEYPIDRLNYMIEDSGAKVLVTTHEIFDSKSREGNFGSTQVIFIDDIDFNVSSSPVDYSRPDGIAYMIYTSGTTGRPKGVMIEHHSLMNQFTWLPKPLGLRSGFRIAEHASFSFDASVLDLMTSLTVGAELHILGEDIRKDPEQLYHYLVDNKIEGMTITTQLGTMLVRSYDLPLRFIQVGGEKLSGTFDTDTKIINGYGPTEFTVCSSYYIVDREHMPENIPIGKAVPNTISAIVDPCGNLLPLGCDGELVLIGPQLARGYWGKPEMTAKRFVACPFIPGEKMYHTGDLTRWNAQGELLYCGRIDTQVKLRGFRIELGEIESLIARYPGVKVAVAQVKEIGGVQHLCAYFTASGQIDVEALKSVLSASLTSYMVPDVLMQLDKMPSTPNGKIDLRSLPVPELSEKKTEEFEAPEGEVETAVAKAFSQALGSSGPLSRNASFFLLGGTSLLVMKVIVRLAESGIKVTYGDVFKYPTPRTLAAFLDGIQTAQASALEAPLTIAQPDQTPEIPVMGEDGFDYTAINKHLSSNKISNIRKISDLDANELGDVLLLGSTGFLGIHILHELLTSYDNKIYCVVRPRKGVTCEGRLKSFLMYYFDGTFAEEFNRRLFVIEGDMTEDSVMDKLLAIKVDTVINCAANVKHFAAGDEIGNINLHGTERLIEFCLNSGSRLIHTSTHSISGQMDSGQAHTMLESELYIGQKLVTKYQTSKFLAERAILDAADKGLKAKIMRLGNLMPRFSDGEFQINIENNGFMARMRAYYLIGCIASSHLHSVIELAPIDQTASSILTLSRTPDEFTVFHPFNNHNVYIDDIVSIMRGCGLEIKIVDDEVFSQKLNQALQDDRLNPYVTTLMAYGSHNNYIINPPSLDFTVNVLNAMDWRWPITGVRYLTDAFEKMKALQYFEI